MADVNTISCLTNIGNTGIGSCYFTPAFIRMAIRVPDNYELTSAELDTLQATLTADTLADSKSARIYPIPGFKGITNNSEDVVTQTLADGTIVVVRDGNYDVTFQYIDGGMCLHKSLRSWNNQPGKYIFVDSNNVLMGWRKVKADGSVVLAGMPALFFAPKWALNDGANVAAFTVRFNIQSNYMNEDLGFFQAPFNVSEIVGLQTVALKQGTTANLNGLLHVHASYGCDGSNFGEVYDTELAVDSLWITKNKTTGQVIDITTVAYNATTGDFDIQLDVADPDYPASATADVTVQLAGPTALAAADVVGFESNVVTVKRG